MTAVTWSGAAIPNSQKYLRICKAGGSGSKHDLVYRDTTDNNKIKAADNGAAATAKVYGMALHDFVSGEYVLVATDGATITVGGGLTAKQRYCLGGTAGESELQSDLSVGEYITEVFFSNSTTELTLDINETGLQA